MRPYELMVILDPTLDERTVAPVAGDLSQRRPQRRRHLSRRSTSGASAGSPTRSSSTPRASTPSIDLKAEPATVSELDRQLSLNESVLRTKVMRTDKH